MVIAMGVMLVTSLLLTASFLAARGDIRLSHTDTSQKEAYYASLAGVQEFEYEMQVNPDYWQTCGKPTNELPQESGSSYKVKILPAKSAPAGTEECSTANPFETAIESTGTAANTFRVESTGYAGKSPQEQHKIVATFKVTGFLNFIYYTNHEDEDPSLYNAPAQCKEETTYYPETETDGCQLIQFASGDSINGPMHTNDAACVGGSASFGRKGPHSPRCGRILPWLNSTAVEPAHTTRPQKNTYKANSGTAQKRHQPGNVRKTRKRVLRRHPPRTEQVRPLPFTTLNSAAVKRNSHGPATDSSMSRAAGHANIRIKPAKSDSKNEAEHETNCANVYVKGMYSQSLTIGSAERCDHQRRNLSRQATWEENRPGPRRSG